MQDGDKSIGGIEYGGAARSVERVDAAPTHFDFLLGVAPDAWNTQPDGGRLTGGIPLLNFMRQGNPVGRGKSDVATIGAGLAKIEEIAMEPDQHRKVAFRGRYRQIRSVGRGDNEE